MDENSIFLTSLGSGSGGNAFFVESPEGALLIDSGFSRKELLARMERSGCDPARLQAVVVTHEHSDHVKGVRVLCKYLDLPLYAACGTAAVLAKSGNLPEKVRLFEAGGGFSIAGFEIDSFPLSHDVETVGFRLKYRDTVIGFATDLGVAGENVKRCLRRCHALIIESNYDLQMLMDSDRRLDLKRRIFGVRGHLDNKMTSSLLGELLWEGSRLLMLAHVSRECNDYELLARTCSERLQELDRRHCRMEVLRQDLPSERFALALSDAAADL